MSLLQKIRKKKREKEVVQFSKKKLDTISRNKGQDTKYIRKKFCFNLQFYLPVAIIFCFFFVLNSENVLLFIN